MALPASAGTPAMVVPGQFDISASGAATYTVPIAVPPGTAGMMPSLSLDYTSQSASSGLVGWGWSLAGLPSISRCPRSYAQDSIHGGVNYDANDKFCLNGQRLVAVNGTYGANTTEYRTEIDNFTKVISYGTSGSGPTYFLAWTKSGQVMEFGNTADSQGPIVPHLCSDPSGTCATAPTGTVRVWAVDKITDTKGNYISVQYEYGTPDTSSGEMRPTLISYTGNATTTPVLAPYNSVKFYYTPRTDETPTFQAGGMIELTYLMTDVKTFHGGAVVHDYKLAYNGLANASGVDMLQSVTLCDGSSPTQICLAPTTFTWQGGTVSAPSAVLNPLSGDLHNPDRNNYSTDFNGDGLTDAMEMYQGGTGCPSSSQSVFLGSYNGSTYTPSGYTASYDPHATSYNCDGLTSFYEGFTWLLDVDGDGLADVLVSQYNSSDNDFYILHNDGAGHLNSIFFANMDNTAKFIGDFNGDGRSDIYNYGEAVWFSNGIVGGSLSYTIGPSLGGLGAEGQTAVYPGDYDGDGCTDLLFLGNVNELLYSCNPAVAGLTGSSMSDMSAYQHSSAWTAQFGDFNGDGKTDILWTADGYAPVLYLSTGTGFVKYYSALTVPANDEVVVGDWNGDGRTDIAFVPRTYSGNAEIYLSTGTDFVDSGVGFSVTNPNGRDASVYAADWNSDGGPDVWMQYTDGDSYDTEYLFTFTPIAIKTIQNGIGVTTTVTYDRLNHPGGVYTKGTGAAYPTQDAIGPSYVVSRVDSSNGVGTGNYSSIYAYAGAKIDLSGRGLQGFTQMTVTDLQTGIVQTTNYLTAFPFTGMVASQTKACPVVGAQCQYAVTLHSTTNTYTALTLGTGTSTRYFVELSTSVVVTHDLDTSVLPTVTTTYGSDCDVAASLTVTNPCFGDVDTVNVAVSDGSNKLTTNTYVDNTTYWLLGRLMTANTTSSVPGEPALTRHSSFDYDLYSATPTGLLTEEIVEPGATDATQTLQTNYTYDAYGNKIEIDVTGCLVPTLPALTCLSANMVTRTTTMTYDSKGEFLVGTCNGLSQCETWGTAASPGYNLSFGGPIKHTGPNSLTTTWTYDTFGRMLTETRPDGTETTASYNYCSGVNSGSDTTCPANGAFSVDGAVLGSGGSPQIAPSTRVYFDTLSRGLAKDAQGFNACWIRQDTNYDAKGRVSQSNRPYFLAGTGCTAQTPVWTVNSYVIPTTSIDDALGRVRVLTNPDCGNATYTFSGLTTKIAIGIFTGCALQRTETTTTTKNAQGLIASVLDPNGKTTSYVYDSNGDRLTTADPSGNVTTDTYDLRGRKLTAADPDMGAWSYVYDSFGELYQQTDAKSQVVTLSYDALGRVVERAEPDMQSFWTFDTATHGIGKLAQVTCTPLGSTPACQSGYTRTYTYDSHSRQNKLTIAWGSVTYYTTTAYDTVSGKITTVRNFSGFQTTNTYNPTGYLDATTDTSTGFVYWAVNTRDAEMHATLQTLGAVTYESQAFDPNSGRASNICATTDSGSCDGLTANFSYSWDSSSDLTQRADMLNNVTESFCYDILNRVTNYGINGSSCTTGNTNTVKSVSYDPLGNILTKSDVGTYSYGSSAGPHAVTSINTTTGCTLVTPETCTVGGTTNPTFAYDADGNMTSGAGRMVTYSSFNMADSVTQGSHTYALTYDTEHQRLTQTEGTAVTDYLNDPVSNVMTERFTSGSTTTWRSYFVADGKTVGERSVTGSTVTLTYFVLDHLGSVAVVTTSTGTVQSQLAYDAWGKMRSPTTGADDEACALPPASPTTRGFTDQEQMEDVCLVNFNARIYDPQIGRFMSADPTTEAPYNLQDLNRYTYVLNNPLSLTDPTGYGGFWGLDLLMNERALVPILRRSPILGSIATIAAVCQYFAEAGAVCGAAMSAEVEGLETGNIGLAARTFAISFAEAEAFDAIGDMGLTTSGSAIGYMESAGLHGMVGGLTSVAEGGKFRSGFIAAGLSDLTAPNPNTTPIALGIAISAVSGGVGSELGGGKFGNGAVTGAFGYLFNCLGHPGTCGSQDIPAIKQEAVTCLQQGAGSCTVQLKQDAEEAGIMPMSDPGKVFLQFEGLFSALPAAVALAPPVALFIGRNAVTAAQVLDFLTDPVQDTTRVYIETMRAESMSPAEDLPEVESEVERWFENIDKIYRNSPGNSAPKPQVRPPMQ